MFRISLGITVALAACGPRGGSLSMCDQDPKPVECGLTCDPTPGAPALCPAGWHCSPDGLCDSQCTPGSDDCGDGYVCTEDGRCVDDGIVDPPGPDAACPAVVFTPMPQTPSIGLVLDQSGSMLDSLINDSTPEAIDPTTCATNPNCRYTAMRDALTGPNGVVTQLQSKAYFGHNQYTCDKEYPDPTSLLQLITTPRQLNNASAIDAQLALATPTNSWNTPTFAAIDAMVADFVANAASLPANSPPAIILATDGLPTNCGSGPGFVGDEMARQEAVVTAAQNAYNTSVGSYAHIPVYVLAMNLDSSHFQEVANVGQGASRYATGASAIPYYTIANKAQLQAAFQTIINGVLTCDLSLTGAIDMNAAETGSVSLNGQPLTYGSDWILVNPTTIRLQGAACDTLKNDPNPNLMASFPCGSVLQ